MENEAYLYYKSKLDEVIKEMRTEKMSVFQLAPHFAKLMGILEGLHFSNTIPTYMYITLSDELREHWNEFIDKHN